MPRKKNDEPVPGGISKIWYEIEPGDRCDWAKWKKHGRHSRELPCGEPAMVRLRLLYDTGDGSIAGGNRYKLLAEINLCKGCVAEIAKDCVGLLGA
jgi:hypothetical protein